MTNVGEIYTSNEGVDGSVATFDNHGSIWGFRSGIFLVGGSVVNAPGAAISGRSEEAINIGVVDNPVEVSLFNAGVLTRQSASSFFDDASVSGSAGKVEVTNTGLIVGDISMFGAAQDTVMNCGETVGDMKTCNGADVFRFVNADQIGRAPSARPQIRDFQSGLDVIDLSAIQADPFLFGVDSAFIFILDAPFSGAQPGELRFDTGKISGRTLIEGDRSGDGTADFVIELTGAIPMEDRDFIL